MVKIAPTKIKLKLKLIDQTRSRKSAKYYTTLTRLLQSEKVAAELAKLPLSKLKIVTNGERPATLCEALKYFRMVGCTLLYFSQYIVTS